MSYHKQSHMKKSNTLYVIGEIEHKHQGLPRFLVIPLADIAPWGLNGIPPPSKEKSMASISAGAV